jgi:uncharacterized protein YebE (UPF0316 family)
MDAFRPLLIAGLVVTEVAIWQWRMVIAHSGSRVSVMLLGIIGAVLQITAITQVVADVSDPAGVIAYAVGVGFGVLLGLVAGEKFTPGMIGVTIVTTDPHLARSLWDRGWPVTAQSGRGESGPVTVLSVPVDRRDETRLHGDVQRIAPDAVCTTRDLRAPHPPYQSGPPSSRSRRTGHGGAFPLVKFCTRRFRGNVTDAAAEASAGDGKGLRVTDVEEAIVSACPLPMSSPCSKIVAGNKLRGPVPGAGLAGVRQKVSRTWRRAATGGSRKAAMCPIDVKIRCVTCGRCRRCVAISGIRLDAVG